MFMNADFLFSSRLFRRRQWHPTPVLLPGKSHGRRSLVGCNPWGRYKWDMTERLLFHFSLSCIGGGGSNPHQCSCLENPRDGGAWWAAIYGVAQSQTRLKRLSSSSSSSTHPLGLLFIFPLSRVYQVRNVFLSPTRLRAPQRTACPKSGNNKNKRNNFMSTCCVTTLCFLYISSLNAPVRLWFTFLWLRNELPRTCAVLSCSVRLFKTPWTVALQAPLSIGILQARILELPCPPPGDLPNPRIKPMSSALQEGMLVKLTLCLGKLNWEQESK